LFQEIREARGLAYSVAGWYRTGRRLQDEASMGAYIGTQSDKTHDAVDTLLKVLGGDIDANRLAQTKTAMESSYLSDRTAPRFVAAMVYGWRDRGLTADPRAKEYAAAAQVTQAELGAWLKKALAGRSIISIVGPAKSIDRSRLEKLGAVTETAVKSLFSY
jgi:predicted Zn-dependent peptidase